LPANWREWTNTDRAKLTPPAPTNTPVIGSQPAISPTQPSKQPSSAAKAHVQDHSSAIHGSSFATFDLYIRITRGFAYLSAIGTAIALCGVLSSLVSLSSRNSSWVGALGISAAFPAVVAGLFLTFTLFLAVDVLQMQKANTENTEFIARRVNATEMTEQRMLAVLEEISSQLSKQQPNS
jgi:hypothetical protein